MAVARVRVKVKSAAAVRLPAHVPARISSRVTIRRSSTAVRTSRPVRVASRASARVRGGAGGVSLRTASRNAWRASRVSGRLPGWIESRGRARSRKVTEPEPKSSPPAVPTTRWEMPVKASSAGSTQLWRNERWKPSGHSRVTE
jgi:hypothetical protein